MAATESSTRAMAALDDLYRRHVGDVYRYTYAVLGNHADAEDVTQTTFVNALRALERGEHAPRAVPLAARHRAQPRAPALAPGGGTSDHGRARPGRPGRRARRGRRPARRARARAAADPAEPARGARDARAGGALVQGDRRAAGSHDLGARDAAVPRAPLARGGAREPRHVPERGARALARERRPAVAQGAQATRRAHRRVLVLRARSRGQRRSSGRRSRASRCCRCRSGWRSSATRPSRRPPPSRRSARPA